MIPESVSIFKSVREYMTEWGFNTSNIDIINSDFGSYLDVFIEPSDNKIKEIILYSFSLNYINMKKIKVCFIFSSLQ